MDIIGRSVVIYDNLEPKLEIEVIKRVKEYSLWSSEIVRAWRSDGDNQTSWIIDVFFKNFVPNFISNIYVICYQWLKFFL